MKYTIKWESNRKKAPITWEKCEHKFPRFSPYDEFYVAFSCTMGNSIGNPWSLQYDGKCMERNHPYYGKSVNTNFSGSPHSKGFVAFSHTMRNWRGDPCISYMIKYTVGWKLYGEKSPILWEKCEYQFSSSSIRRVLLHFPVMWEIYGETHAFPICWSIS